jgi:hypothetical protein
MEWINKFFKDLILDSAYNKQLDEKAISKKLTELNEQMEKYKNPYSGNYSPLAHMYYQNILPYAIQALKELQKEQITFQKEILIEKNIN